MKLHTAILILASMTGAAYAQNPDVIQDTRSTLQNIQKKQVIDQNAVLTSAGQAAPTATPAAPAPVSVKPAVVQSTKPSTSTTAKTKPVSATKASVKPVPAAKAAAATAKEEKAAPAVAVEDKKTPVEPKKEKNYSAAGRRDPFISPVVNRTMVSTGCSTGKRCLEIGQIVLTGIVKSDSGMIAVVVNAMNKAYFLRENDPVFNGYVVKITGDSIVFQETVQDNLGKPLTREVTKKISTPAV
jgi:Tfp pilus assembly protein PilP